MFIPPSIGLRSVRATCKTSCATTRTGGRSGCIHSCRKIKVRVAVCCPLLLRCCCRWEVGVAPVSRRNPRAHASLGGGGLACSASDLSVGPHEESDPRPLGVRRDPGPSVGTRSRHVPQHHLQGTKRRAVAVEWGGWGWWGLSDSRRVAWSRGHLLFADTLSMVVCACAANSGPPTFTTRTL